MTEVQANKMLAELRTIRICAIIVAFVIALASAKETYNL